MMETFVEQGSSRRECLGRIVAKYGERVVILREKNIRMKGGFLGLITRQGVELEFYIPPVLSKSSAWPPYQTTGGSAMPQAPLNFEEAKKQVLAAAGKDPAQVSAQAAAQVAAQAAAQAAKDEGQRQILDAVLAIKEKIESGGLQTEDHPSLVRAAELFKLNDFSESYINGMIDKARKELPLETLDNFNAVQDRFLEWIGESIAIYRDPAAPRSGRILALVGPTGVGKTTTIAKLAAIFGIGNPSGRPPLSVRMITIDAFRIGARAQIEAYGEIMGFPVSYVDNRRDLKREIALYQDETDLILVDTIGKSPRDSAKLGEMKELLDACGSKAEIHLVFSASTKTSDIGEILRQFEPFNYRSVVLTKLDETRHIGNVISALAERGKSVSWITDGQKVPNDIKKASVVRFLIKLDEFKVDRDKMEKRFPVDEADQFQWS